MCRPKLAPEGRGSGEKLVVLWERIRSLPVVVVSEPKSRGEDVFYTYKGTETLEITTTMTTTTTTTTINQPKKLTGIWE